MGGRGKIGREFGHIRVCVDHVWAVGRKCGQKSGRKSGRDPGRKSGTNFPLLQGAAPGLTRWRKCGPYYEVGMPHARFHSRYTLKLTLKLQLCVRVSGESVSACVRVSGESASVCVMNPGYLCGVRARYV